MEGNRFVTITSYDGPGTGGVVESHGWSVLLLNYLPRLQPIRIRDMQKHTNTDECFILLQGKALLFTADGEDMPDRVQCDVLETGRIYRVPQGIWHAPAMTEDAKILLVEGNNTTAENSPRKPLTQEQCLWIAQKQFLLE